MATRLVGGLVEKFRFAGSAVNDPETQWGSPYELTILERHLISLVGCSAGPARASMLATGTCVFPSRHPLIRAICLPKPTSVDTGNADLTFLIKASGSTCVGSRSLVTQVHCRKFQHLRAGEQLQRRTTATWLFPHHFHEANLPHWDSVLLWPS